MEKWDYAFHTGTLITGMENGFEECEPGHSFGPYIRDYWLLHYVERGHGLYRIHGQTYTPGAGEVFFIPPYVSTYYEADRADPWTYKWVGLLGSGLDEAFAAAGLTDRHPVRGVGAQVSACMDRLIRPGAQSTEPAQIMEMYRLLDALQQDSRGSAARPDAGRRYVEEAEAYVRRYLYRRITVEEVAAQVNVDRSYLTALFKKHRDCSTQQFILDVKMQAACDYLIKTDYDIARIAKSVGYEDVFVFSHAFRTRCGVSPSGFRAAHRAEKSCVTPLQNGKNSVY